MTACPKMIGSDTFIMVALRWTDSSTSSALARAICAVRKACSAATRMTVESTTSPASTGTDSRSTVSAPASSTRVIAALVSAGMTTDFSLERKSSASMCATLVLESLLHTPIECGCLRA